MDGEAKGLEIINAIAARAYVDDDFRAALLANPKQLLREAGLEVPDALEVVVHENSEAVLHLVLPAVPPDGDLDINEVELTRIAVHFGF